MADEKAKEKKRKEKEKKRNFNEFYKIHSVDVMFLSSYITKFIYSLIGWLPILQPFQGSQFKPNISRVQSTANLGHHWQQTYHEQKKQVINNPNQALYRNIFNSSSHMKKSVAKQTKAIHFMIKTKTSNPC